MQTLACKIGLTIIEMLADCFYYLRAYQQAFKKLVLLLPFTCSSDTSTNRKLSRSYFNYIYRPTVNGTTNHKLISVYCTSGCTGEVGEQDLAEDEEKQEG